MQTQMPNKSEPALRESLRQQTLRYEQVLSLLAMLTDESHTVEQMYPLIKSLGALLSQADVTHNKLITRISEISPDDLSSENPLTQQLQNYQNQIRKSQQLTNQVERLLADRLLHMTPAVDDSLQHLRAAKTYSLNSTSIQAGDRVARDS